MKNFLEKLLWSSRYMTILAVWSCIVGMALLFTLSAIDMGKLLVEFVDVYVFGHDVPNFHTVVVSHVITAVDDFLLAIVLLIFALGVYELHIDKLDFIRENETAGKLLQIESLDDLKDRLGKVILMILIVSFFKNVLSVKFDDPLNILYMGGGIFLVALASYFGHKGSH
ncbi:putative membrane protein YqhA [Mariprofundus ferrinatatus]|uniref:Putative membrane protein YqhA n=1 Tax=Mariprofundus ferrinatatus TaxID=1921087 RepID=A0A2K8L974_9PROT|nr:YqhA family protein [Mariprofundus ferrinatatus]ATX82441.1 putative membrane protein YqhA [Mariprofundus ferrinatatus]